MDPGAILKRLPPLLCAAMPFGYGPASKLIALARRLAGAERLVFVGEGAALELVARSGDAFDEVVAANPADPAVAPRFAEAWGVLSLMDRDAGIAAARAGKPFFAVDSLLWMRPEVPAALRSARICFAQRFPGFDARAYDPRPRVVGPLVPPHRPAPGARREGLVVHVGGSAAPDGRARLYADWARLALRAVLDAGLVDRYGSVTVVGGAQVIAALEGTTSDAHVERATLSTEAARARMAGAAALLTAPGLTTALEAFSDGTPTWFLPPQNYSQWCILRRLAQHGLADGALHWEEIAGVPHLAEKLRPADYDAAVSSTIGTLVSDARVAETLRVRLASVGERASDLLARQTAFLASLGPNGLDEIASTLRRLGPAGARRLGGGARAMTPLAPARRSSPWTS